MGRQPQEVVGVEAVELVDENMESALLSATALDTTVWTSNRHSRCLLLFRIPDSRVDLSLLELLYLLLILVKV